MARTKPSVHWEDGPETLKALDRINKDALKVAKGYMREHVREVNKAAWRELKAPQKSIATQRALLSESIKARSAGSRLRWSSKRARWALASEIGSEVHPVYGRKMPQSVMRSRVFPSYRGWFGTHPGIWWVPTIRRMMPQANRDSAEVVDRLIAREMRRAGVPTRHRS